MKTIILLLLSLMALSCGKRSGLEFFEQESLEVIEMGQLITFNDFKNQIILPHCISCHKKSDTEEGIEKWFIPGNPDDSKLYQVIKDGRMPKKASPLSAKDLEFTRQYILDALVLKNLEKVSFNVLKEEILSPHCLKCHKKMNEEEALLKWINFNDPYDSPLLKAVEEERMPKRAPPLTDTEKNIVKKYINNFLNRALP